MKELEKHEAFEMMALDVMRKTKILDQLLFGGGTMLRLCFDLPRYSVDFDFYLKKERKDFLPSIEKLNQAFETMGAQITDQWEKHYSFLWEIRMAGFPKRLKIEIRKEPKESQKTVLAIAHSSYSPLQVRLRVLSLEQMWQNKIAALIDRKAIRDAYDLEFLSMRKAGNFKSLDQTTLEKLSNTLNRFSTKDLQITLGALFEKKEREQVLNSRFAYLQSLVEGAKNLNK